jgi:hypothetical protein
MVSGKAGPRSPVAAQATCGKVPITLTAAAVLTQVPGIPGWRRDDPCGIGWICTLRTFTGTIASRYSHGTVALGALPAARYRCRANILICMRMVRAASSRQAVAWSG